jgi:hypothetical protein
MAAKAKRAKRSRRRESKPLVSRFLDQHGDYRHQFMPDPEAENRRRKMVSVVVNRAVSTVDKWLHEGGPGFEAPQGRAIKYCRRLWNRVGCGQPVVANYDRIIRCASGGEGDREGYLVALHELHELEERLGLPDYWRTFEDMVRFSLAAGRALGVTGEVTRRHRERAKKMVGFVASKIAEWRRF